jgi:two-component system, NarL family, response regulator DevR
MSVTPSGVIFCRTHLWVDALRMMLAAVPVDVVGATQTQDRCLKLVEAHNPDVLAIDSGSSTLDDDLRLVRACCAASPRTRVVMLSDIVEGVAIQAALDAGVTAFAFRTAAAEAVVGAVREAVKYSTAVEAVQPTAEVAPSSTPRQPTVGLTSRELEILGIAARGLSNGRIAQMLWITEHTVKFHLSNVYRKLGVSNRTEASRWAHVRGIRIDPSTLGELPAPN